MLVATLVAGGTYAVVRYLPPQFTATSIVWLGEQESAIIAADSAWSTVGQQPGNVSEQSRTLVAVLTSVPILRRVAEQLELHERPDELQSRASAFVGRLRDLVGQPGEAQAVAAEGAILTAVPGTGGTHLARLTVLDPPVGRSEARVASDAGRGDLVDGVNVVPMPSNQEGGIRQAVARLAQDLEVDVDMRSEIAVISFTALDPELAAQVVNEVPRAFAAERRERLRSGTGGAVEWLEARVDVVRDDLLNSERALEEFRAENGLTSAVDADALQLERLVRAIDEARAAEALARERLEQARSTVDDERVDTEVFGSAVMGELVALRAATTGQRRELLTRVGPDHALVRVTDEKIDGLNADILAEKQRLVRQLEADVERTELAVERATQRLVDAEGELQTEAARAAGASSALGELQREVAADRALYENLLERLKRARQVAQIEADAVRIIQPALVPQSPSSLDNGLFVAAAGFGSLMLGFALVGGLAVIDRRISHADQLAPFGFDAVIGAPRLEPIRDGRGRRTRRSQTRLPSQILFDEAMRRLLASTLFEPDGDGTRTILVTSGSKHEGKTTIAFAVATQGAVAGRRTVLVEGDLRRPGRYAAEARATNAGLSGYLEGRAGLDDIMVHDAQTGLYVVPTTETVQHSTELLASARMRTLIEALRAEYDFVVIDSAPVCLTSDPQIIARAVDDVVFVVRHGESTMERTRRSLDLLPKPRSNRFIAFVNMTDETFFNEYYGPGEHAYAVTPRPKRRIGLWPWASSRSRDKAHARHTG
ncbi:GumC family protein [Acuticoccus sp.]|uniref:GumC family protein n=1 Tax=Acuticoccus sp. TaxID=1904378 RepID=UPI003B52C1D2